jgi:putative tryptophan/tyrosine transport system substrate-binding protein
MRRRDFIKVVASSAITWPLAARGQQPTMPVIGFLNAASSAPFALFVDAFRRGLRETGYIEGQNTTIEFRWAEGHNDRLPALVADLVQRHVSVIVAIPSQSALAAKAATGTIPIVFEAGIDPVAAGLVVSLNRPGGNITGIANLSIGLIEKQIEIMRQVASNTTAFGVLLNPTSQATFPAFASGAQAAATSQGVNVRILKAGNAREIDLAFETAAKERMGAVVVSSDPLFVTQEEQIVALAARTTMPAIHAFPEFVAAGGLMSYGPQLTDAYRLTGIYAGRILNGEKPADLPVQQAVKVELVVNLKTAKALGVTIPLALLGRADEVIE